MKYLKYVPAVLLVLALIAVNVPRASANPLAVISGCRLASATSTFSYMTAGKATTTLTCDTYAIGGQYAGYSPDTANLAILQFATSTASITDINIEYSNNNVDWYQNAVYDRATTTPTLNISVVQNYRLQFASTTAGLPAIGANASTTSRMIKIDAPARYVRAVFTVPAGASASGVWAEITTKQQVHE